MAQHIMLTVVIACSLLTAAIAAAGDKPSKKGAAVKEVRAMSEKDQTALALGAAPGHIAKEAGIMIYCADGKLTETKKSANGFTWIPTVMNLPEPDPICMDAAVYQWLTDLTNNAPKPTNTVPGIAYVAHGGSHFEKGGKVVMSGEGAKVVNPPTGWSYGPLSQQPRSSRPIRTRPASISCLKAPPTRTSWCTKAQGK